MKFLYSILCCFFISLSVFAYNVTTLKANVVLAKIDAENVFKEIRWLNEGQVVERLEDIRYIADGVQKTASLTLVKQGDKVGFRVSEGLENLPSMIRQLLSKPSYKPFRSIYSKLDKTTTFIGKWDEIVGGKQNGLQKVFDELSENDLNIYMQSGKFDHPGGFNMLSIEDWNIRVVEEAAKKGIAPNTKAFDDYIWETYNKSWLESALQRGKGYKCMGTEYKRF